MLTRRLCFASLLSLLLGACSTALLVDTPYDDLEPVPDSGVVSDAGLPLDAGLGRDAGLPRDAAVTGPDAAAFPRDCARALPVEGFATLFTLDCLDRRQLPCSAQVELDRQLVTLATRCGVARGATIGFMLSAGGCPDQLRYDSGSVRGEPSFCLQTALEGLRFACPTRCGVLRVGSSP